MPSKKKLDRCVTMLEELFSNHEDLKKDLIFIQRVAKKVRPPPPHEILLYAMYTFQSCSR